MARLARIVVPGLPHQVTQRGNQREAIFFEDCDQEVYLGNAEDDFSDLRCAESTGRPLGTPEFVTGLENLLGSKIARRAPVRKPETQSIDAEQLELLRIGIVSPDSPSDDKQAENGCYYRRFHRADPARCCWGG